MRVGCMRLQCSFFGGKRWLRHAQRDFPSKNCYPTVRQRTKDSDAYLTSAERGRDHSAISSLQLQLYTDYHRRLSIDMAYLCSDKQNRFHVREKYAFDLRFVWLCTLYHWRRRRRRSSLVHALKSQPNKIEQKLFEIIMYTIVAGSAVYT